MRTVVSYDDIATPQNNAPTQLGPPLPSTATQPPAKKRRTAAHHQKAQAPHRQIQHWDDPGTNAAVMNYGGQEPEGSGMDYAQEQEEEEEESRDLTHDEIWDDSALIDAWNSATAEYEVRGLFCSVALLTYTMTGVPRQKQEVEGGADQEITFVSATHMLRCPYLAHLLTEPV